MTGGLPTPPHTVYIFTCVFDFCHGVCMLRVLYMLGGVLWLLLGMLSGFWCGVRLMLV